MLISNLLKSTIFLWFAYLLFNLVPCFLGEWCGSATALLLVALIASVVFVFFVDLMVVIYKRMKNKKSEMPDNIRSGTWITSLIFAVLFGVALSHVTDWTQGILLGICLFIPFFMLLRLHVECVFSDIKSPIEIKAWMVWIFFAIVGGLIFLLGGKVILLLVLPILLVDVMWIFECVKKEKNFVGGMMVLSVLSPYLVIGYFLIH